MLENSSFNELQYYASKTYVVNCNWKLFIENYCDGGSQALHTHHLTLVLGYHVSQVHKSLTSQLDMSTYNTKLYEKFSVQSVDGAKDADNKDKFLADRVGKKGAFYAYVYPNFMINRYGDIMDTNLVIPMGHDKCR
jgi:choline monooxygenase